jgi:hypothetical protein
MENKVPFSPFTLSEFRIIQLAKEGLPKLLLGLISLLVLNSCSKEATLDEVRPSSVESISELKTWATKNDHLNQAKSIEWDNAIPIMLPDSVKGYSAPVKTASGYKEFITFELEGIRQGLYKSYKLLNSTDMQIVIQTAEGKTIRSGFIRKKNATAPKGKSSTMRKMNFEEGEIVFDTWFDMFIFSAPSLNSSGGGGGFYSEGGFYFGNSRFDMNIFNYYLQAGLFNAGYYGGGNSQFNFYNYSYPEITNSLKSECFNQVLDDLISHNLKGKMANIIELFDNSKAGGKFNFTIEDSYNEPFKGIGNVFKSAKTDGKTINLNTATLSNSSKEYIAKTIMHEILHIYLNNKTALLDHTKMAKEYVTPMAELLSEIYNINLREAKIICTIGLDIDKDLLEKVLVKIDEEKPVTTDERDKIFFGHTNISKNRYGKYCN